MATKRKMNGQQHSAKEKRQAEHIAESYEHRGMSDDRAKSIAFATVNKQRHEDQE